MEHMAMPRPMWPPPPRASGLASIYGHPPRESGMRSAGAKDTHPLVPGQATAAPKSGTDRPAPLNEPLTARPPARPPPHG